MTKFFFAFILLWAQVAVASEEFHFSPKGGCQQAVVDLINATNAKLDVAVYSINNAAIIAALQGAKARGVSIRILTDSTQAAVNADVTLTLVKQGFDIRLHSVGRIMHNKFVVSDGQVETGSFNWTEPAEESNEENCVIISHDGNALAAYGMRFTNHLWVVNTQAKSDVHLSHIHARQKK
jgi:phosphatidylserine/phosphatidylglycerophosphate/cardiolipin synthase-like enzyme